MSGLSAALWAEGLKLRRSKVPWLTGMSMLLAPLVGGLLMFIIQHPERARAMRLITLKAQIVAGVADWPTYFGFLQQSIAVGGGMTFALLTAWTFGREWVDRTLDELLAVPTSRRAVVTAKFAVIATWVAILVPTVFGTGLVVGTLIQLPGWTTKALVDSAVNFAVCAALTAMLVPVVAFLASAGRGYLPALGWALLTIVATQLAAVTGWGGWFPWAVPALHAGAAGPPAELLGAHSYLLVVLVGVAGYAATVWWWATADHTL
jgi:ABC-2 type transport system permease protein